MLQKALFRRKPIGQWRSSIQKDTPFASTITIATALSCLGTVALLVLAALSYLAVLTVNNPWWQMDLIGDTPVFNLLLLAYGVPVLLALALARFSNIVPTRHAQLGAAASFLLFTALEIRQLWQGSDMAYWQGVSEAELYTYSIVGMAYAIGAILWSIRRDSDWLHKGGMGLLGVIIAKIFLVDMSGLQGFWRVAAFMGLGLALLGLAWMYRRTRKPDASSQDSAYSALHR